METKTKQNEQRVPFSAICKGEPFVYDGEVYVRLAHEYLEYDYNGYEGDNYNAIHLGDAELYQFAYDTIVNKPTKVVPMEVTF